MMTLFAALVRSVIEYCAPLWAPNRESHKHKLEGVQRSFTRYCFPCPWYSRPYDTRLRTLDIPTTISRFRLSSYHVCCWVFWGKYDISWEDYIKVNTSNSRQVVNVNFDFISGAELMLFITHCLFHFQGFGPPYPMIYLKWNCLNFFFSISRRLRGYEYIINCFFFFFFLIFNFLIFLIF